MGAAARAQQRPHKLRSAVSVDQDRALSKGRHTAPCPYADDPVPRSTASQKGGVVLPRQAWWCIDLCARLCCAGRRRSGDGFHANLCTAPSRAPHPCRERGKAKPLHAGSVGVEVRRRHAEKQIITPPSSRLAVRSCLNTNYYATPMDTCSGRTPPRKQSLGRKGAVCSMQGGSKLRGGTERSLRSPRRHTRAADARGSA